MDGTPETYGGPNSGGRPRCAICGAPVRPDSVWTFCPEHATTRDARIRDGVDADSLEVRWGDVLRTWRDRPPALADDPDADRLRFIRHHGDWVVFRIGYPSGSRRLPDHLAVNRTTHEIRRFVDHSWQTVRNDLDGLRAAPGWEERAVRWGRPESHEARRRGYRSDEGRLDLKALMADASIPIFVPGVTPWDLHLRWVGWGGGGHEISSLRLIFADRDPPTSAVAVELTSIDRLLRDTTQSRAHVGAPEILQASDRYRTLAWATGMALTWPKQTRPMRHVDHVDLGGRRLARVIVSWPEATPFSVFELSDDAVVVQGGALGLTVPEVLVLLRGLVPLQRHPEVIAAYARDLARSSAGIGRPQDHLMRAPRIQPAATADEVVWPTMQVAPGQEMDFSIGPSFGPAHPVDAGAGTAPPTKARHLRVRNATSQVAVVEWVERRGTGPVAADLRITLPPGFRIHVDRAVGVEWIAAPGKPHEVRGLVRSSEVEVAISAQALGSDLL